MGIPLTWRGAVTFFKKAPEPTTRCLAHSSCPQHIWGQGLVPLQKIYPWNLRYYILSAYENLEYFGECHNHGIHKTRWFSGNKTVHSWQEILNSHGQWDQAWEQMLRLEFSWVQLTFNVTDGIWNYWMSKKEQKGILSIRKWNRIYIFFSFYL